MARDYTIKVRIQGEDDLSPATQSASRGVAGLSRSLKIGLAAAAAAATAALTAFFRVLSSGITAANAEEQALATLTTSLTKYGVETEAATEASLAFANQLQAQTTFSNDNILATQALLSNLGVLPNQLKDATRASADLAAALGIDILDAARRLGRTFGGTAGELAELIPELSALGREALIAGDQLAIIEEKFGGTAQAQAATFAGRITQLRNAWSDLTKELGKAITENETLSRVLAEIQRIVTSGRLVDGVVAFAEGLSKVVSAAFAAGAAVRDFARGVTEGVRAIGEFILRIPGVELVLRAFGDAFGAVGTAIDLITKPLQFLVNRTAEYGKLLNATADAQRRDAEIKRLMAEAAERGSDALDGYNAGLRDTGDAAGDAAEGTDELVDNLEALNVVIESNAPQRFADGLRVVGQQAGVTSEQFDRLLDKQQQLIEQTSRFQTSVGALQVIGQELQFREEGDYLTFFDYNAVRGGTQTRRRRVKLRTRPDGTRVPVLQS